MVMREKKLRLAATALIYKDGLFVSPLLGVARKDNHQLFGLPGGKVDDGETTLEAMVREVWEETGLQVKEAIPLFFREEEAFLAVVYLVTRWSGEIATEESGKVEWVDFATLKRGSFPDYNAALEHHLAKLSSTFGS